MKKQLIYIWCGIATWIVVYEIVMIALLEFRLDNHIDLINPFSSMLGGLAGGLIVLSLSGGRMARIQLIPLALISAVWVIAFPTPSWESPIWFNWPLWGIVTLAITLVFGQKYLTSKAS